MGKKEIDNLITIHKADGVLLTNSYGTYRIMQKDVGLLKLNSGQIMLADPLVKYRAEDFARRALAVTVEPGLYPVEIYMADSSNDYFPAFASIRFRNNTPVAFVPAVTIHDQEHKRRPPFRYVVEAFPDMPGPITCWTLMMQKIASSHVLLGTLTMEH